MTVGGALLQLELMVCLRLGCCCCCCRRNNAPYLIKRQFASEFVEYIEDSLLDQRNRVRSEANLGVVSAVAHNVLSTQVFYVYTRNESFQSFGTIEDFAVYRVAGDAGQWCVLLEGCKRTGANYPLTALDVVLLQDGAVARRATSHHKLLDRIPALDCTLSLPAGTNFALLSLTIRSALRLVHASRSSRWRRRRTRRTSPARASTTRSVSVKSSVLQSSPLVESSSRRERRESRESKAPKWQNKLTSPVHTNSALSLPGVTATSHTLRLRERAPRHQRRCRRCWSS